MDTVWRVPRTRAPARLAALTAALIVLAGCGSERTPVPSLSEAARPKGGERFVSEGGDVSFRYPSNWALVPGEPPATAHVLSGVAVVTVWSYRRNAVPFTAAQARLARRNLIDAVRQRDRTYRLRSSRLRRVDGARAVELIGAGSISGRRVVIRSVHAYKRSGEYVIDAYAPASQARRLDRSVFRPLIASVRLRGRPPPTGRG